ncbi:regulator [Enterovibrio norvegicus]|uniref:regulator n=1 Tax=Enterovibrio norvegicus TaxID=188144 RepID=UPI000C8672F7|nr:regulator [Enterovibrio norvegicus]MCC4798661.1 hypothetical protein [Enterovibrio norvegicus]PMI36910.1 regulator [Enterovibrio norvegicus]PMN49420.1 regulator [Enterovibrio norvegicus]
MNRKTNQNYIFRRFQCGLTKKEAAKLCFKSVKTIENWDAGSSIPPECKRLMRMHAGREICGINDEWYGWRISNGGIVTPANEFLDPDRIITGAYLLSLGCEEDKRAMHRVLRYSRLIRK